MSDKPTILRFSATFGVKVSPGDEVRSGDCLSDAPGTDEASVSPVSGRVQSVRFDPAGHEFVVTILPDA